MVSSTERRILLASGSPRRRELLSHVGFEPVVAPTDLPEVRAAEESPQTYTQRLARMKAQAAADAADDDAPRWVLAADTIVVLGERVLEKPRDPGDAVAMLLDLAGEWHQVMTSFCWLDRTDATEAVRTVTTEVHCRAVDEAWIRRYVATGEPMDKAGSYGIQDIGSTLVADVRGSYSAVVGLPLCEVVQTLEELGGLHGFPFTDR